MQLYGLRILNGSTCISHMACLETHLQKQQCIVEVEATVIHQVGDGTCQHGSVDQGTAHHLFAAAHEAPPNVDGEARCSPQVQASGCQYPSAYAVHARKKLLPVKQNSQKECHKPQLPQVS